MHVIRHSADGKSLYFIFPCDTAEIRPEALPDFRREPRTAFAGGKYAMLRQELNECMVEGKY
ncbi:MAG TPA: hypothetical protein VL527_05955 [Dongiaceae bacterium]|nr:hypothetical protein [Dongiaceae bacterium]